MAEHPDYSEQPAVYEQLLHVPMKAAWDRLLDFGGWADWAPNLFQSMKIINGKKGVGAIRRFKTGNDLLYEELLAEADEAAGHFRYDFVSIVPKQEGLDGVISRVTLVPVDKEKTLITWKSWTKFGNIPEQGKQRIQGMQRIGFMKETQGLEAGIIFTKILQDGMAFFNKKVMNLSRSLLTKQGDMWQYDEYPDNFGFLPKMVKGLPPSEVLPPHKIGGMLTRFLEVIYLQAGQIIDDQNNPLRPANPNMPYLQETMGMMQIGHTKAQGLDVLTDHVVKHWTDDAEFCRQLIQGVNPLHIKMVNDIHEVPDTLAGLTTPKSSGESLTVKELIAAKRLFILDYSELATYTINPPLYFSAPVLLVYREILDKNTSRLNILGIQLHPSHKEVYTPDMPQKNRYKLAKMFVASADNQFHEFRYHLGISHMGVEPIVIATHNRIPKDHPIKALLTPHFEGTIGIAYFARQTLIDVQDPFTDKTFALGTHQGIKLASDGWRKYDFFKSSFPEQLKARGFDEAKTDGVQDYFYREDGFKLWNFLGDYATDFVNKFYATDASVLDDSDVQRWADELASKEGGNLPGFPNIIKTRQDLIHVLQIIIWNCSAQHSAINYSQWPYLGYIPNRPNALYQPMPELPEDGSDITDEYVAKSLASTLPMLFQITFPWLLTVPSDSTLLNLNALKDIYPQGNAKFHENMTRLTLDIKSRNQALEAAGKAPYIYLLPENVAASVTI